VHKSRVIFIDLARALAVVFMLYGHAIDALLAPSYKAGVWHTAWQFQRGLTSSLFLLLSGFAFSVATGRHWSSHTTVSAAWWRRVRRFALFVVLGYMLHFPAGRVFDLPWAQEPQWRSFYAADVLQLIGVTFIGVQCLLLVVPSRRHFSFVALALAVLAVALQPLMWSVEWSRWLPMAIWAYLSPVFGADFPLFPLFPWAAFILIGVALGQLYARWGGAHLGDFARRALILPGAIIVLAGYGVAFYPHEMFAGGARSLLPVDMAIRAGACLLILGAIALASGHLMRLPHVFSAMAQETLLIYFIHLCIIYGSAWSFGLVHAFGAALDPWGTLGIVLALVGAMAAMAAYWNWLKHARPDAALWVGRVAMAVLVAGFVF
jgi:acyltransferase